MSQPHTKPSVCVLLSTYNGEKYLRRQLDSLLNQTDVSLTILIRDDGSKDNTVTIIKEYMEKHPCMHLTAESNCGVEPSFDKLCLHALGIESDYYAFCDQDDVWDDDKLLCAVKKLETFPSDKPNLYYSNLRMVDENENYIRDFYVEELNTQDARNLVQIYSYGCTCVFNRSALQYYCKGETRNVYHDNWISVVCAFFGNIVYDPEPHIAYRQHASNVSGHRNIGFRLLLERLNRAMQNKMAPVFGPMAAKLIEDFKDELTPEDFKLVKLLTTYRKSAFAKMKLMFSRRYKSSSLQKNLGIEYRIMTNKL